MPHAAAMVCHGGFGTVRAGLEAGLPLAVLPLFADQPYNAAPRGGARRRASRSTTRAAWPPRSPPCSPSRATRGRAAAVAADARALPPVDDAVSYLHTLADRVVAVR